MTVAQALTAELARQGISLNELARRADVSPSRVHSILAGTTPNPGILTVAAVLAALGKSLTWLDRQLKG